MANGIRRVKIRLAGQKHSDVYSVYSGSGLLLENETENASRPSNQNDTQLLEAIRTYG